MLSRHASTLVSKIFMALVPMINRNIPMTPEVYASLRAAMPDEDMADTVYQSVVGSLLSTNFKYPKRPAARASRMMVLRSFMALENAGYFLGYTGKAWDPGNFKDAGWQRNPVAPEYNKREFKKLPTKGISKIDYVANFKDFLTEKPTDKPFFFWYGAHEPHRDYEKGSGLAAGFTSQGLIVPPFYPIVLW